MKLALVGATGLVGQTMLAVLAEEGIVVTEFYPVASKKSKGKLIEFLGKQYEVITVEEVVEKKPDVALFSAGSGVSLQWAEKFEEIGCYVIDNSSAWRMDPSKKLVVPEINGDELVESDLIIANPNCSTIQMVLALFPLHKQLVIERLVISTYQSMTGTGVKAVKQYEEEEQNKIPSDPAYPHPIYKNCIPHCDDFLENGYTKEEMKLVHETRKILSSPLLKITATSVRVPVVGGHSESVNVRFEKEFNIPQIKALLNGQTGVLILDDPSKNIYPTPLQAAGRNEVYVGRLRKDFSEERTLNMWVVSDNLRKGAATNAVQIVKCINDKGFLSKN